VADHPQTGPVLFGYDGSDLARLAIERGGPELASGRAAVVLCVWQPADVGFKPTGGEHFDALDASEVRQAAEAVAAEGAALAAAHGFRAEAVTIEAAPTWKGIAEIAEQRGATLIVLGSHRRHGVLGHLLGSVTSAVLAHSDIPVLVVHEPA
jgi:nucleotide-binding universal stress UspA family protein